MKKKIILLIIILGGLLALAGDSQAAIAPGDNLIADTGNPAWLKRSNGSPFFLCGPGDPEGFLYRGTRNADGTRNGDQMQLIEKLKATGANSIYFSAIRSHGGDGTVQDNPFVDSDPAKGVSTAIINQWETWFTEMDNNNIVIFFILYDDSVRLFNTGDVVSAEEKNLIQTLVNRFEHHANLIWVVAEEYQEALSAVRVSRIAAEIRAADSLKHPIGVHKLSGLDFSEFSADPNIDQFAIQYNLETAAELHSGVTTAWNDAAGRYNLNMAEAVNFGSGATARQKMWAAALGGAYIMAYQWDIANTPVSDLQSCGRLRSFMESTNFRNMSPHDELRLGGTLYILANPGQSYIAYSPNLTGGMGIKNLIAGTYNITWLDTATGATVNQTNITIPDGDKLFSKPLSLGNEVALYVLKTGSPTGMVFPGINWQEASPESQQVDSAKLNAAMNFYASKSGIHGVTQAVVIRNGYLIWKGNAIDTSHNVWSVTKSFTSTVMGLLLDDGLATLDTKASDYVSMLKASYPNVTLRHFATMTSGYDAIGGDGSLTPFDPATPLFAPGTMFQYWDSAMNTFALTLTKISGKTLYSTFKSRIADPIGMDSTKWTWGNFGTVDGLLINGGAGNKTRGISISAREAARFGHLFLNRGNWAGKQIISSSWVDQATKVQVPASLPRYSSGVGPGVYGFNWWANGAPGNLRWPSAPASTYKASGFNNNQIIVIPEWNMVIVRLGVDEIDLTTSDFNNFFGMVGASILSSIDTNPPAMPTGLKVQ